MSTSYPERYIPQSQVFCSYRPSYTWENMQRFSTIRALDMLLLPEDALVDTLFIFFKGGTVVAVEAPLMYPRATNVVRGTQCLDIPIANCSVVTRELAEEIMYKGVERMVF